MASPSSTKESTRSTNIAARMGRWSARHRKKAIFGWLAFVVVAFAIGNLSVTEEDRLEHLRGWASPAVSDKILHEEFKQPAGESVIVQSETLERQGSPAFAGGRRGRHRQGLGALHAVAKVGLAVRRGGEQRPDSSQNRGAVARSTSRSQATPTMPPTRSIRSSPSSTRSRTANPGFFIGSFGVSADKEIKAAFFDDLKKAGLLSIP